MKTKILSVLLLVGFTAWLAGAAGTWKQVGKAGDWAGTIAGTVLDEKIYTVETSGSLYVTDPASGVWKQIGKNDFANTQFLFAAQGSLYSIEKSGALYGIKAETGSWKQVGKSGSWANTLAACVLQNKLYTVEASGALYVTDLNSGTWKQLGKNDFANTVFIQATRGKLFSIEKDGSMYSINPASGFWTKLGKTGAWQNTIVMTASADTIYTVEKEGILYKTDPESGLWDKIGNADFAATRFMWFCNGSLFAIESSGNLYRVDIGAAVTASSSMKNYSQSPAKSEAAQAGNLTFKFMGNWRGDEVAYKNDPKVKAQEKDNPDLYKMALGMVQGIKLSVTLDGITMEAMGDKIGPIKFTVVSSSGNTLVIETQEPNKKPSLQTVTFTDGTHITMVENLPDAKPLFLVKQ